MMSSTPFFSLPETRTKNACKCYVLTIRRQTTVTFHNLMSTLYGCKQYLNGFYLRLRQCDVQEWSFIPME